jgi:hypothetical protein
MNKDSSFDQLQRLPVVESITVVPWQHFHPTAQGDEPAAPEVRVEFEFL